MADTRGEAAAQARGAEPGAAVLLALRPQDGVDDRPGPRADAHRPVVPRPDEAARRFRARAARGARRGEGVRLGQTWLPAVREVPVGRRRRPDAHVAASGETVG